MSERKLQPSPPHNAMQRRAMARCGQLQIQLQFDPLTLCNGLFVARADDLVLVDDDFLEAVATAVQIPRQSVELDEHGILSIHASNRTVHYRLQDHQDNAWVGVKRGSRMDRR